MKVEQVQYIKCVMCDKPALYQSFKTHEPLCEQCKMIDQAIERNKRFN